MKIYNCNTYINNTSYTKRLENELIDRINNNIHEGNFDLAALSHHLGASTSFKHNTTNDHCINVCFDVNTKNLKRAATNDKFLIEKISLRRKIVYHRFINSIENDYYSKQVYTKTKFIKLGRLAPFMTVVKYRNIKL